MANSTSRISSAPAAPRKLINLRPDSAASATAADLFPHAAARQPVDLLRPPGQCAQRRRASTRELVARYRRGARERRLPRLAHGAAAAGRRPCRHAAARSRPRRRRRPHRRSASPLPARPRRRRPTAGRCFTACSATTGASRSRRSCSEPVDQAEIRRAARATGPPAVAQPSAAQHAGPPDARPRRDGAARTRSPARPLELFRDMPSDAQRSARGAI